MATELEIAILDMNNAERARVKADNDFRAGKISYDAFQKAQEAAYAAWCFVESLQKAAGASK